MLNQTIPEQLETERLILRRPQPGDAEEIFDQYASKKEVVKYMSWPRHESLEITEQVVVLWLKQWSSGTGGAFLITESSTGKIIGSTGFDMVNPNTASTGYILAKDEWGKGYATEALSGIVRLAQEIGTQRLYAYCHHAHRNSARVMEKCGFEFEGRLRNYMEFPNLSPGTTTDVMLYAWIPNETNNNLWSGSQR
jgi:ribosomal-protein-alanine N-acetyltransferase